MGVEKLESKVPRIDEVDECSPTTKARSWSSGYLRIDQNLPTSPISRGSPTRTNTQNATPMRLIRTLRRLSLKRIISTGPSKAKETLEDAPQRLSLKKRNGMATSWESIQKATVAVMEWS